MWQRTETGTDAARAASSNWTTEVSFPLFVRSSCCRSSALPARNRLFNKAMRSAQFKTKPSA